MLLGIVPAARLPALRRAALLALLAVAACGRRPEPARSAAVVDDPVVPTGRLPADVRPTHYDLDIAITPSRDRFSGTSRITVALERARSSIWMHGRELDVQEAVVETPAGTVPARWEQVDPEGVVELRPERPVGPGTVTLRFRWDAAFDPYRLGLYRLQTGGAAYAFTQFEPTLARRAFPCFDEPRFKTPFDVTLTVPREHVVVANTPALDAEPRPDGTKRVRFAPTEPLPTYLLAFAVGPLAAVDGPAFTPTEHRLRPVPFRGITTRGGGRRLAYALAHTAPYLGALEGYFGLSYPYPKLDIVAVPDVTFGGMENAGAIFFRESGILLDAASAPEDQRRGFAYLMAHELAHQWFGDLVTLAWWDDLWLNEAFATWIGTRVVAKVHPEYEAETGLLESVLGAMDRDSLVSARRIRQPIDSLHDIPNAFDAITYSKGAGVLAMFEHWIGVEPFRRGIQRYLEEHRSGSATADDLLRALSAASGRDVGAPFRSFLDQPGVPLVDVRVACDAGAPRLAFRQSRFLPVGSTGERAGRWQIPLCVRFAAGNGTGERCTLLSEPERTLRLDGEPCPGWLMPNADGAGYYRWALPGADLARLQGAAWPKLTPRERLSVADSVGAAFAAATVPAADVYAALEPLAADSSRAVAVAPMSLVRFARDDLADDRLRPRVEAFARRLYAPVFARLGWEPRPGEDGETRLLRGKVIGFLADVGRDRDVRATAAARGRRLVGRTGDGRLELSAVAGELIDVVLAVAVQDGNAEFFDALVQELRASGDALTRGRLLTALGATHDPRLAARARALSLDPGLRLDETLAPIRRQMADVETREATWEWVESHFDALTERLSGRRLGDTPWLAASFCDASRAAEVERFFEPRIRELAGGPRNLAGAVEAIRLCAARVAAQRSSAAAFFGGRAASTRAGRPG